MNVTVKVASEKLMESRDYRDFVEILIDDKEAFSVYDGEPEDNTIARNFSDVHNIVEMMHKAYLCGLEKGDFNVNQVEVSEEE